MTSSPNDSTDRPTTYLLCEPLISVEETWAKLASNIRQVLLHHEETLTFAECYYLGYELVARGHAQMLYDGVSDLLVENLNRLAKEIIFPALPPGPNSDLMRRIDQDQMLLNAFHQVWSDHLYCVDKVNLILKYMDSVLVRPPSHFDLRRGLFVKHIIRPPIKDHVISSILSLTHIERDGHIIDRSVIKNCVNTLLQLRDGSDGMTVYQQCLEPEILRQSEAYYEAEVERLLETCDGPEYLRRVETCLVMEERRVRQYLSLRTLAPLRAILEKSLLTMPRQRFVDIASSGMNAMIDQDMLYDLSRLYRLCPLVPEGLPSLHRSLKGSIQQQGTELNRVSMEMRELGDLSTRGKAHARPQNASAHSVAQAFQWVEDVVKLKAKFDRMWEVSFKKDHKTGSVLDEAFESFINLHPRASEFISLYIDNNLKGGLKGRTDAEVEAMIGKAIALFKFITEKDVFERYYQAHLVKRLLQGRSVSDDAERGMLAKLIECGFQSTVKLEGMFHDMKLSVDTMQAYRDHLVRATVCDINISVTVLTPSFWPIPHSPSSCMFPPLLVEARKSFEQFYRSRYSGRKLTWQSSLGNADVRATFKARKHDLNVSSLALIILLLFEDLGEGEFLTYEEIKNATAIPGSELQRNLQSLACSAFQILRKHPSGRDVNSRDSFSFNADFSSPLQKITLRVSAAQSGVENGEERKETQGRIDEERRYQTDACIVRIMKDRKHMTHNELINETTRQLSSRFLPDPMNIKKRIEALIEREYLQRCEDHKSYDYLT